jgi:hypothetical protein
MDYLEDGVGDPELKGGGGRRRPVDESVENLVGILRTQYLGSATGDGTFAANAKITGLLLRKTT